LIIFKSSSVSFNFCFFFSLPFATF
jgi:hypothetical protein